MVAKSLFCCFLNFNGWRGPSSNGPSKTKNYLIPNSNTLLLANLMSSICFIIPKQITNNPNPNFVFTNS